MSSTFCGDWIEAGHPAYGSARLQFNRRAGASPAVIARCLGVADVVAAVAHARERELPIEARSGGLALGAPSVDGGMLVDLGLMRGVHVRPDRRIARIQGGTRGGDLQVEAGRHGLAGATGALSGAGVGLMLGAGIGHLSPRVGYATDNILSMEVVTATGDVVVASPDVNPDLFWAMRGSQGNFGIVTALEVQLHEVPPLVRAGALSWSLEHLDGAIDALRKSWQWSDRLSLIPFIGGTSFDGRGGLEVLVCHTGTPAEAEADIERLLTIAPPDEQSITSVPFADLHFQYDDWWTPMRGVTIQQPVTELRDDLVEALVASIRQPAGGGARLVEMIPLRGGLGRAPTFPSALREAAEEPTWSLITGCWWEDPSEDTQHQDWVRDVVATIQQIGPAPEHRDPSTVGVPLDADGVARMYGDRFDRLREVKRRWDPGNLFSGIHPVPPAEAEKNVAKPAGIQ